jgi:hypothetical protein
MLTPLHEDASVGLLTGTFNSIQRLGYKPAARETTHRHYRDLKNTAIHSLSRFC